MCHKINVQRKTGCKIGSKITFHDIILCAMIVQMQQISKNDSVSMKMYAGRKCFTRIIATIININGRKASSGLM